MAEITQFRTKGEMQAEDMAERISAVVDGHDILVGMDALMNVVASLIVGYSVQEADPEKNATLMSKGVANCLVDLTGGILAQMRADSPEVFPSPKGPKTEEVGR